jgi:DNA-binding NarL/FixJ family response regulator
MAARHTTPARDDPSRPPLFSPPEWQKVVQALLLSPRQAEIVGFVIQARSDKEIASTLGIRPSTVRSHLEDIARRIGATNRISVVYQTFAAFRQHVEFRPPRK